MADPTPIDPERRRKLGNPGKRTKPKPPPDGGIDTIPRAPRGLGEIGKKEWRRVWTAGAQWLDVGCDSALIAMLCEAYEERAVYRAEIQARPMTTGSKGQRIANPATAALRNLDTQITSWEALLALTPKARVRYGLKAKRP
jgi:P27 family predicted phage terminase small subunit